LENDLLALFLAVEAGTLLEQAIQEDPRAAATVMLVSKGYPEEYEKGKAISSIPAQNACAADISGRHT